MKDVVTDLDFRRNLTAVARPDPSCYKVMTTSPSAITSPSTSINFKSTCQLLLPLSGNRTFALSEKMVTRKSKKAEWFHLYEPITSLWLLTWHCFVLLVQHVGKGFKSTKYLRGGDCGVDNIWSTMTFVTRPVRRKRELNEGQGPRQEKSSGPVWGSWMRSFGLLPSLPHTQTPIEEWIPQIMYMDSIVALWFLSLYLHSGQELIWDQIALQVAAASMYKPRVATHACDR